MGSRILPTALVITFGTVAIGEEVEPPADVTLAGSARHAAGIPNGAVAAGRAVDLLRRAARTLETTAPLELKNATICRTVRSFGDYDEIAGNTLEAGDPLLVYLEVDHFASRLEKGRYVTRLDPHSVLSDTNGGIVKDWDFAQTIDYCRSRRRDYFLVFDIGVPKRAEPGRHTLRITVEDSATGREATVELPLEIVEQKPAVKPNVPRALPRPRRDER